MKCWYLCQCDLCAKQRVDFFEYPMLDIETSVHENYLIDITPQNKLAVADAVWARMPIDGLIMTLVYIKGYKNIKEWRLFIKKFDLITLFRLRLSFSVQKLFSVTLFGEFGESISLWGKFALSTSRNISRSASAHFIHAFLQGSVCRKISLSHIVSLYLFNIFKMIPNLSRPIAL